MMHGNTKHGMCGTPTYVSWYGMLNRCRNPKQRSYETYGGRGITVCDRWLKFENFLADMGERPPGMTIERIDNTQGYFASNCRWATDEDQRRNRGAYRNSRSGVKGVRFHTGKWRARISTGNGKTKDIGGFATKEEAIAARAAALK